MYGLKLVVFLLLAQCCYGVVQNGTGEAKSQGIANFKYGADLKHLRYIFYMVTPAESTYPTLGHVPKILDEAAFWFAALVVLELIVAFATGHSNYYSLSDSTTSVGAGLLQQLVRALSRGVELRLFVWIYENYCIHELPWNSAITWLAAAIGVDFMYYWFHRAVHEISILWCFHQMHHSSEYYNLTTALRQGMVQPFVGVLFYLPLALFVPPQAYLVHNYFNLLYQFWIHTRLIKTLGPLELIMNTPSHHRVHHGRNPYCIDKNYAGTLIIWDRLFGTFIAEKEDEPVSYGLVHVVDSFNPLYGQLFLFKYVLVDKLAQMKTIPMKAMSLICGPGWEPGTARLGDPTQLPQVDDPSPRYTAKPLRFWLNIYIVVHFVITNLLYFDIAATAKSVDHMTFEMVQMVALFILSLQCYGMLLDNRWYAPLAELMRCCLILSLTLPSFDLFPTLPEIRLSYANIKCILMMVSCLIWIAQLVLRQPDDLKKIE